MAELLPNEYTFGFVVGRAIHAVADTAQDVDKLPEARPADGEFIFTPAITLRKSIVDYKAFVGQGPEHVKLDKLGRIVDGPTWDKIQSGLIPGNLPAGPHGIWLITGTYTVTSALSGLSIPAFQVEVTAEHTEANPLDLVTAAPPQPGPGVTMVTAQIPPGGSFGETLARDASGNLVWTPVPNATVTPELEQLRADTLAAAQQAAENAAMIPKDGHSPVLTWVGTQLDIDGVLGPDLQGTPGPAPVTSWDGTSLVVDGVTGPDLRGQQGTPGAPGALANASSYILVGPGRPDTPATTGGIITGSEPVGSEYRSTDGANVGAWKWSKRPAGWAVVDGDTGWMDATSLLTTAPAGGRMLLRRRLDRTTWRADGLHFATAFNGFIAEPAGFATETFGGGAQGLAQQFYVPDGGTVAGRLTANRFAGNRLTINISATTAAQAAFGEAHFTTAQAWPSSRPVPTI